MTPDLRCTCPAGTLLAKVARDPETGAPCLHVKVLKRRERALEMLILSGTTRIRCRDCGRWFRVSVTREKIAFRDLSVTNDCESTLEPSTVAADRHGNDSPTPRAD